MNRLVVGLILVLALVARLLYMKESAITFMYDQARDMKVVAQIVSGDIKIQGPPVSLGGFYHGVLYYYILAIPYLVGNGNPIFVWVFMSCLNLIGLAVIYLLAKICFGDKVAIIASILYAVSFDVVSYANWLSNPSMAVFSVGIYLLGLGMIRTDSRRKAGILLTGVGLGLSIQSQFFLAYLTAHLIIIWRLGWVKLTLREIVVIGVVILAITSSMWISYIKFGPTFLIGLQNMTVDKYDPTNSLSAFQSYLFLLINRLADSSYKILLPQNAFLAGVLIIFVIFKSVGMTLKRESDYQFVGVLTVMFGVWLSVLLLGGESTPHVNAGMQIPTILLVSYWLEKTNIERWTKTVIVLLIVAVNLVAIVKYNRFGQITFAIQKDLTLKNEIAAIDYVYTTATDEFSINTITSPFWINTLWDYLFTWYGRDKYGYVPSFHGRDQVGRDPWLKTTSVLPEELYLIIEPQRGMEWKMVESELANEDAKSSLVEEVRFGELIVQKRKLTK